MPAALTTRSGVLARLRATPVSVTAVSGYCTGYPSSATTPHPPHTSGRAMQRGGVPGHHGDSGRCSDLRGTGVPLRCLHIDVHPGLRRTQGAVCCADVGPGVLRLGW